MIHVQHFDAIKNPNSGNEEERFVIHVIGGMIPHFKSMVQRALNCWPDAHPALKELGDMLMHGEILQDYYRSRTDGGSDGTTNFKG